MAGPRQATIITGVRLPNFTTDTSYQSLDSSGSTATPEQPRKNRDQANESKSNSSTYDPDAALLMTPPPTQSMDAGISGNDCSLCCASDRCCCTTTEVLSKACCCCSSECAKTSCDVLACICSALPKVCECMCETVGACLR